MDGVGLTEDGREAEVANLDLALVAVHEDVVTLGCRREVSTEGGGPS